MTIPMNNKLFNKPYKLALGFVLIVVLYFLLGYLNYARAGKLILNGFFTVGLLSSIVAYFPHKRWLHYFALFIFFVLFLNLQFHAFLRDIFGVAQDDLIVMQAIFETNKNEAKEFFLQYKFYLLKHTLLFVTFFIIFIKIFGSTSLTVTKKQMILWFALFCILHLNPTMRRANPFIYFPYYYTKWKNNLTSLASLESSLNKQLHHRTWFVRNDSNISQTVVWVIGESDTRHNWSLYGYQRLTTPKLSSLVDHHLFIFDDVNASAPATVAAFERMLTPATRHQPNLWKQFPDIVYLAKKAGFKVYWITNQVSDQTNTISIFAKHADFFIETNKGRSRGEGYYDDVVINPYQTALQDPYPKKFIIVHLMGSHPAYDFRYPKSFSKFTYTFDDPVMLDLQNKGRAKWALVFRNLYDNTILHTDSVLAKLLIALKENNQTQEKIWIYHSDHGQDVCHHTNFSGHNYKAKEQWDIPFLVWDSQKTAPKHPIHTFYDVANIYYTLLGLMHIKTNLYKPELDIFNSINNHH